MALIKLTAFIDQISGKVNGSVFAKNKGGAYVRSKSKPTNPRTGAQMAVRSAFGAIASKWRSLTTGQRNAWNGATNDFPYQNKLGDTKSLSGFGLHQKLNANLSAIGMAPIVAPPQPRTVAGWEFKEATAKAATQDLEITGILVNDDDTSQSAIIYATAPLSAGVDNFDTRLRQIDVVPLAQSAIVDLATAYSAHFGTFTAGQKIGFAVKMVHNLTGQAGVETTFSVIVT